MTYDPYKRIEDVLGVFFNGIYNKDFVTVFSREKNNPKYNDEYTVPGHNGHSILFQCWNVNEISNLPDYLILFQYRIDDRTIGYAISHVNVFYDLNYEDRSYVEVLEIYVEPEYRSLGIGTALYEEMRSKYVYDACNFLAGIPKYACVERESNVKLDMEKDYPYMVQENSFLRHMFMKDGGIEEYLPLNN